MSIYVCACRDGAHIKHLFAPYDNEAEKRQNGES